MGKTVKLPISNFLLDEPHAHVDKLWGPYPSVDAAAATIPAAMKVASFKFGVLSGGVFSEYIYLEDNGTPQELASLKVQLLLNPSRGAVAGKILSLDNELKPIWVDPSSTAERVSFDNSEEIFDGDVSTTQAAIEALKHLLDALDGGVVKGILVNGSEVSIENGVASITIPDAVTSVITNHELVFQTPDGQIVKGKVGITTGADGLLHLTLTDEEGHVYSSPIAGLRVVGNALQYSNDGETWVTVQTFGNLAIKYVQASDPASGDVGDLALVGTMNAYVLKVYVGGSWVSVCDFGALDLTSDGIKMAGENKTLTQKMAEIDGRTYVEGALLTVGEAQSLVIGGDGTWKSFQDYNHYVIAVDGGDNLKICAKPTVSCQFRWLKSHNKTAGNTADVSSIDGLVHTIPAGGEAVVTVPSDSHYLYLVGVADGTNHVPTSINRTIKVNDYARSVNDHANSIDAKLSNVHTMAISASGSGAFVNNARMGFEAGKTYRIVITLASALSEDMGVRLYATNSTSSEFYRLDSLPKNTTSIEYEYTADANATYQYLGGYKNEAGSLSANVTIYSDGGNINDKIAEVKQMNFIEPFEAGGLSLGGANIDSPTGIRTIGFINIKATTTLKTKNGYTFYRIIAYNQDGTFDSVISQEPSYPTEITLTDTNLKYRFTVRRSSGGLMSPDEDCMEDWTVRGAVKKLVEDGNAADMSVINAAERKVFVAAYNSTPEAKAIADYVCDGVNDEVEIQTAINSLRYGGTVQLFDGQYNIDAFPTTLDLTSQHGVICHVAILLTALEDGDSATDDRLARTIKIVGTTENRIAGSLYGVHIHVTDTAIENMNDTDEYTCFMGSAQNPLGDADSWAFLTSACFENFVLFIGDAQKKIVGFNCIFFTGCQMKKIYVQTEHYREWRMSHVRNSENGIPTSDGIERAPVLGSVGIIMQKGGNHAANCGMDTVFCNGMYYGFVFSNRTIVFGNTTKYTVKDSVDHLIMTNCGSCRCVYGYYFQHGTSKTLTLINCLEEGCAHLPRFEGYGHITAIDFNVERLNRDHYPIDLSVYDSENPSSYAPEFYATEIIQQNTNDGWIGTIEYTLEHWSGADSGNAGEHFWKNDGSGKGIRTRNLNADHTGYSQPHCGEYLERYFDTVNNVMVTYNGSSWVDENGNPSGTKYSGTTANRPSNVVVGTKYFDTTLGKPIWYKGSNIWVDASGQNV